MLRGLKNIIIFLLYFASGISALGISIFTAMSYYQLKKGGVFEFLKFMSLDHSIFVAILIGFAAFFFFLTIYGFAIAIINFILDFIIEYIWWILGVSFLGILALPFLFLYAFIILPLKQIYIFIKYFKILIHIKFWNLYPLLFISFFGVLGFLFYYFNVYEFLEFYCKKLLKFILSMKKFDYLAFLYFMIVCFVLNLINFVFILLFRKINTILYLRIYKYLQNWHYRRIEEENEYNKYKDKNIESLILACEIFSFNPKKINEITQEELKKHYHKLAKMFHPDLHRDKKDQMDKKMKDINNAYEFLKKHIEDK